MSRFDISVPITMLRSFFLPKHQMTRLPVDRTPKDEPDVLKEDKQFHSLLEAEWGEQAEGSVRTEVQIIEPGRRKRRIDIFVDTGDDLVVIIEIISTKWDRIKANRVRPKLRRHIRQVWDYMGTLMGPENEGRQWRQRCSTSTRRRIRQ